MLLGGELVELGGEASGREQVNLLNVLHIELVELVAKEAFFHVKFALKLARLLLAPLGVRCGRQTCFVEGRELRT